MGHPLPAWLKAINRKKRFRARKLRCYDYAVDGMRLQPREARFVEKYAGLAALAFTEARRLGHKRPSRFTYTVLAAHLLPQCGYRVKTKTAKGDKNGELAARPSYVQARDMLALPSIQRALDVKFQEAGLPLEDCAKIIAEIAHGQPMGEVTPSPRDRLAAIDMRIRMTTGYAPTTSKNLNINARTDRLFERETFAQTPDVALEKE